MLKILVPKFEGYNQETNEFFETKEQTLSLEHSLVSLSKWEAKWQKAFLGRTPKTQEETIDYVRCMTLTQNVKPEVYYALSPQNYQQINDYIEQPMTATTIRERHRRGSNREVMTAEVIYYYMIAFHIPFECQKWHLNRLLTLIKVCDAKQDTKKMSKREILESNANLNEQRKQMLNTKG